MFSLSLGLVCHENYEGERSANDCRATVSFSEPTRISVSPSRDPREGTVASSNPYVSSLSYLRVLPNCLVVHLFTHCEYLNSTNCYLPETSLPSLPVTGGPVSDSCYNLWTPWER